MLPSMGPPLFTHRRIGNLCVQKSLRRKEAMSNKKFDMSGKLFIHMEDGKPLDFESIDLLEQVGIHGSIARTAREIGISYPKVWHTIDYLNRLSEKPLVVKSAGGRGGGGGTTLTEEGRKFLKRYRSIQRTHMRFIRQMENRFFMK
jgi:molybdate transport system regulatory protein